ncbi:MAG: 4'-phosphopantetheinyl transferase superfamily protein [Vicinamibacterales bacterium]
MPAEALQPPPAADEVHLWTVPCEGDAAVAEALLGALSARERARAGRLVRAADRHAFVIGRARVRQVLAAYVGQPPAALDVVARVGDKPVLAGAPAWLDFSFSRCAALHVCAVASRRRVGVDVETVGTGRDAEAIAAVYFTADERSWLAGLAPAERPAAFADLWVKKEAFVKAIGAGLAWPLDAILVPRGPRGHSGPVVAPGEPDGRSWCVETFTPSDAAATPAAAWVGAVAAEGEWRLTRRTWPDPPALRAR